MLSGGPADVALPSAACRGTDQAASASLLRRHRLSPGFRVLAVDLPGSGRSEPRPRSYDAGYYEDDARALLGLLDALGISAAHLAGFSDGGEEAVLMAELRPGLALSLFTWGAAGKVEARPDELASVENVVDQPTDGLAPLAAYLATAYDPDIARIMTQILGSGDARYCRRGR